MSATGLRLASADYEVQHRVVHGYRRAFVRVGSGPAVLLIHGIGNTLHSWRHAIGRLAEHYTVIAPDLLGHGASDKPRADYSVAAYANGMRDLLSVLDIERATVVGHSLGGGVATQFAYQYPDRCERLVLVSTGGVARDVHPMLRWATLPGADITMSFAHAPGVSLATRAVLRAMEAMGHDLALDRGMIHELLDSLRDATSRRAFARTLRAVVDHRGQVVTMLDRCYLATGIPILLVWGARDAVIPLEHGQIAHAAMPGSRLEIFEDAGHFPHHKDPLRFVNLMLEFIEGTKPAAHSPQQWREILRQGRPAVDHRSPAPVARPRPLRAIERN